MQRLNYRRFLARQQRRRIAAQGVTRVKAERVARQQQRLDIENWAREETSR